MLSVLPLDRRLELAACDPGYPQKHAAGITHLVWVSLSLAFLIATSVSAMPQLLFDVPTLLGQHTHRSTHTTGQLVSEGLGRG